MEEPDARVTVKLVVLTVIDWIVALEPETFIAMPFTRMLASTVNMTSLPEAWTEAKDMRETKNVMVDILIVLICQYLTVSMLDKRSNQSE